MSGRRPHTLKPSAFFRTLRERVPELTKLARLEFELFSNVDSCEMQPEAWSRLATLLHERLDEFDGAVVTHGTDTLAYTASALSFMLRNLDKPVVLTGAQRPLGEIRSDARLNLIDAVTSAIQGPKEVTVCFDSRLFRGNRVRKVSVSEYDAFDSPNCPALGVLGVEARFKEGLRRTGRRSLAAELVPEVFLLRVFPGLEPALVLGLLPQIKGLVVEAYGAGNFAASKALGRSLEPVFKETHRRNIPVVMVSQAHRDSVDLSLYESGAVARSYGAISGGDLTVQAAVVKLMHALAHVAPRQLRDYIERSVAGERS